jgi:hypothetical protein
MIELSLDSFLVEREEGEWVLRNQEFVGVKFSTFSVRKKGMKRFVMENVVIRNCSIELGTVELSDADRLHNVEFDNFCCTSTLFMPQSMHLSNVRIAGKKFPRRFRHWLGINSAYAGPPEGDGLVFDVRDFRGEVEIVGIPFHRLRLSAERHAFFDAAAYDRLSDAILRKDILWFHLANKARSWGGLYVFSMPKKSDRDYADFVADIEVLKAAGAVRMGEG